MAYYHHYRIRKYLQKFSQKTSESNKFRSTYHGGILIEFAFSIPILISLLFFVCDYYRYYELKNKVKSSAYLAASMVQQVSNTRTDKQLTQNDLARISYASCLNFFHTNSMFPPCPLGIYYGMDVWYVKRIDSDNYQCQECYATTSIGGGTALLNAMNKKCGAVNKRTKTGIIALHPDLVCNKDGDERILIICSYRAWRFKKSKLGLFILEPKLGNDGNFSYKLVITPKPGLFPGKNE